MNTLLVNTCIPATIIDIEKTMQRFANEKPVAVLAFAQVGANEMLELQMCCAAYYIQTERLDEAGKLIDNIVFNPEIDPAEAIPALHLAWLWLARMTTFVAQDEFMLALGAAENVVNQLTPYGNKKQTAFLGILASLLYNLAYTHHHLGDSARAQKELTKAQKLYQRLVNKDCKQFVPMLIHAIEASTQIISSRQKQLRTLELYQQATENYMSSLQSATDNEQMQTAINNLVDSLANEGAITLQMGNARNAIKYYTKALRYQRKLNRQMGLKELELSIGLSKALMRVINRRDAARQLLTSLLPLARRIEALDQAIEIENLLHNVDKNSSIMTKLKSLF